MWAFRRAIDLGCSFLELDVHMSADGVPVVIHDAHVDRTARNERRGSVASMTVNQLRKIQISSEESFRSTRNSIETSRLLSADTNIHAHVPTLSEVLKLCSGSKTSVLIEMKPKRVGSFWKCGCTFGRSQMYPGLARAVVRACARYPEAKVVVQSFCREYCEDILREDPTIECHLLLVGQVPLLSSTLYMEWSIEGFRLSFDALHEIKRSGMSSVNVSRFFVSNTLIQRAHACGLPLSRPATTS